MATETQRESMPTYTVSPKPGNRKGWKVESNGRVVSRHNKKENALSEARRLARNNGGTITVQGANGQFQRRITP